MQKKLSTISELCEYIWALENKYKLLDYEIDGVKFWQCARMQIYYALAQGLEILEQPHSNLKFVDRIWSLFQYQFVLNSIRDNIFTLKQADIVVIPHPRTVNVDGENIDIYTKYLIDDLNEKCSVVEFLSPYLGAYARPSKPNTHFTDWIIFLRTFLILFTKVHVTEDQRRDLRAISTELKDSLGVILDVERFAIKQCENFKVIQFIYSFIFRKIRPKSLFTVIAYGQAPVIKAAKDLGIEVIEIQHGTFSEYHLGYSFPGRKKALDYFPDKFYVWNAFWGNMIDLPIEPKGVVVDSFRFLENQKTKFSHFKKEDKQIIVLSQGAIGNAIAQKILDNLEKFAGCLIMYKLHPGEFDRWENYPALRELSAMENVKIIKDEVPLYQLFATSGTQVGVFSTALYEGVEFGCNTVLLDLPGIEYMKKFTSIYQAEILK